MPLHDHIELEMSPSGHFKIARNQSAMNALKNSESNDHELVASANASEDTSSCPLHVTLDPAAAESVESDGVKLKVAPG